MSILVRCPSIIQWNSSNPDTNGTEESVHISEVSLFQGLLMQELFLGKEKVSLLERCPHFRGVLRERFNCITVTIVRNILPFSSLCSAKKREGAVGADSGTGAGTADLQTDKEDWTTGERCSRETVYSGEGMDMSTVRGELAEIELRCVYHFSAHNNNNNNNWLLKTQK